MGRNCQAKRTDGRRKALAIVMAGLGLAVLLLGTTLYQSANGLTVSHYTQEADLQDTLRVVQLSDLHNSEFGPGNQRLVERVAQEQPDLIFLTGDLLNRTEETTACATQLIEKLAEVAPVYLSFGNHETAYQETFGVDLRSLFTEAGATVLDFDYIDLTIPQGELRLGGLYGYCLPPQEEQYHPGWEAEFSFLEEFQSTERWKVLLCHMPVCWLISGSLEAWEVDCVFAGHAHGGEVILPWLGGLYAPDQGWFPGRLWGTFSSENGERLLVLSRGLGTAQAIPRMNNVPEIVVVDFVPTEEER